MGSLASLFVQNEKKKKYLKAENKLLRENLKRMSDNVNLLISKINVEHQKIKKIKNLTEGAPDSPTAAKLPPQLVSRIQITSQSDLNANANTEKLIQNLTREQTKLRRRMEVISAPDFLANLKRDLRTTEEEIKQQEKLKRQLKLDQLRRERKLDNILIENEPEAMQQQVHDTMERLAYLKEKIEKLEEENAKADELRDSQVIKLD